MTICTFIWISRNRTTGWANKLASAFFLHLFHRLKDKNIFRVNPWLLTFLVIVHKPISPVFFPGGQNLIPREVQLLSVMDGSVDRPFVFLTVLAFIPTVFLCITVVY